MNERERKEFEDYFKTTEFYENMVRTLTIHNFPAKALDMQRGEYKSVYVQLAFDAWQASANRDGYKMVPVEADDNMEHAGHCALINGGTVHKIYKAMIGAVDDKAA